MGIIKQLPDNIANQIAAGEVVQRPSSVVKELLENAVDAGANDIKLIVKDGGRSVIQVIDNGKGMTRDDAMRCFDRHATSKIDKSDDLFNLHTFGFRGEALASIASVAQVELKTKLSDEEVGTKVEIEGSREVSVEPCSLCAGSSFSVKNLFFNVPARRNFLKSDIVEYRHIVDEFNRVALVCNDISFSLINNGKEVIKLPKSNPKQRIVNLMGASLNNALYPIKLNTDVVEITGFIGKPEAARKIKGNQFFFCNGRFIKSAYFNHAISEAFKESIDADEYPSYFVYFRCDPSRIDVNIHPTKTEVKFLDEKLIYTFLRSAVREAIGKFGYVDMIDFESIPSFEFNAQPTSKAVVQPKGYSNPSYNPFASDDISRHNSNLRNWDKLFENIKESNPDRSDIHQNTIDYDIHDDATATDRDSSFGKTFIQVGSNYIVSAVKSGLAIINRQAALERIIFDRLSNMSERKQPAIQSVMFPQTFDLAMHDAELMRDIMNDVRALGFDIEEFGGTTFVINGIPPDIELSEAQELIEGILNSFKASMMDVKIDRRTNVILSAAKRISARKGGQMTNEEMESIVNTLFQSEMHGISPSGKDIIRIITNKDIEDLI